MKRLLVIFGFAGLCVSGAMAEEFKGYIVDKNCSTKSAMLGDEACAKKCIKGGALAVLATEGGKVYAIANQNKVVEHAGHKVTVTGKLEGNTITVEKISM